ncbi:SMI1/KNR4 family protein [Streptococcus oricebi]|uniref:SMI1/KNR4 family protein n=1 Tax=Streptococcus oricebi TaxID=1547447 RepID=A0ABS5B329_9STRE|nr:SMI1/KNR4 family protein [Streptococcus oricebi]MBP2623220.1 SMI1/KNR4 family protein [Streptococcus oricebi]
MLSKYYLEALNLIDNNQDLLDDFGGCSENIIQLAENTLGVVYPKDYKDFLKTFGAGNFGSTEIYGLFKEDFANSGVPDSVWYTLLQRKKLNFPQNLVIIYDSSMGEVYCLNYHSLNQQGEPQITGYILGLAEEYQKNPVLYNSFGEFLLDMVTLELENE